MFVFCPPADAGTCSSLQRAFTREVQTSRVLDAPGRGSRTRSQIAKQCHSTGVLRSNGREVRLLAWRAGLEALFGVTGGQADSLSDRSGEAD